MSYTYSIMKVPAERGILWLGTRTLKKEKDEVFMAVIDYAMKKGFR